MPFQAGPTHKCDVTPEATPVSKQVYQTPSNHSTDCLHQTLIPKATSHYNINQ